MHEILFIFHHIFLSSQSKPKCGSAALTARKQTDTSIGVFVPLTWIEYVNEIAKL
jgi:hypothetical protein